MRSRYVAYVRGDIDYLERTQDPATASSFDRQAAQRWARRSQWLGLQIVDREAGGEHDDSGVVQFVARYMSSDDGVEGAVHEHGERSRFRKHQGRWVYVDGQQPPARRASAKVGRNDPCSCGSKRKYKRCCGR